MKIRKLEKAEHNRTRLLYETVFSEDEPCFVDYYYQRKAKENEIYVAESVSQNMIFGQSCREKILAMLHLNPCRISWNGKTETIRYIVAVATQEEYRHQGLMRQLLIRSVEDLYEQQAPFAFLMPASEAIYTPFGFRRAWSWRWEEEILSEERKGSSVIPAGQCSDQQLLELSGRVNEALSRKFSMFSLRSPAYYRNLDREQRASGGKLEILFAQENGREVPVSARCSAREEFPPMMTRIIHLQDFIRHVRSREQKTFYWQITDKLLPENSGSYKIILTPAGGELFSLNENDMKQHGREVKTADIAEIPELLAGDNPFADAMICEVV